MIYLMLLTASCVALILLSLYMKGDTRISKWDWGFGAGIIVGAFSVLSWVLPLIIQRCECRNFIIKHEELQATVERARAQGIPLENAAILSEIAESNRYLKCVQYWNDSAWDWCIPDEVDTMEVIK
jgi:hypothetical protein